MKNTSNKLIFERILSIDLAIVLGFILMGGPGSTETHFEPDIFSFRRIKLAPTICFAGFLFVIYAIMHKPKNK